MPRSHFGPHPSLTFAECDGPHKNGNCPLDDRQRHHGTVRDRDWLVASSRCGGRVFLKRRQCGSSKSASRNGARDSGEPCPQSRTCSSSHQATHYNSVIALMGTWIFCSTNYGNFWRTDASPGRWHDFDEQKRLSIGHIKSGSTSLPLPLPHMVSLEISAREPPPLCLPEIGSYA